MKQHRSIHTMTSRKCWMEKAGLFWRTGTGRRKPKLPSRRKPKRRFAVSRWMQRRKMESASIQEGLPAKGYCLQERIEVPQIRLSFEFMTEWITVISLILFGEVLIVAEIIFVPGTTLVGVLGFIFLIIGIGLSFHYFGSQIGWISTGGAVAASGLVLYYSFK